MNGKFLFIDGNNLGVRTAFANSGLRADMIDFKKDDFNPDEAFDDDKSFPTSTLHGFFKTLAMCRQQYPEFYIAVVWDSGYKRRTEESQAAVEKGVIPEPYKANRHRGEKPQEYKDFQRQKPHLQEALSMTNMPQVVVQDEEADDVIASYAATKYYRNDVLVNTTDHDFYQLFRDKLWILKGETLLDRKWFYDNYGIEPFQWVDVGATMGDDGDNIFGLPGWGEVTAVENVKKSGGYTSLLANCHENYDHLREQFPDLKGDEFSLLKELRTAQKEGSSAKHLPRLKYPGVCEWMPFTGVAWAFENKKVKLPKALLVALMYESRVEVAYRLKKMHTEIAVPDLPPMTRTKLDEFRAFCQKFKLVQVEEKAELLCSPQEP